MLRPSEAAGQEQLSDKMAQLGVGQEGGGDGMERRRVKMMRMLMEECLDERGSTFLHTRPTCISTYIQLDHTKHNVFAELVYHNND